MQSLKRNEQSCKFQANTGRRLCPCTHRTYDLLHGCDVGLNQTQPLTRHVMARKLGLLVVVDTHVTVYIQYSGSLWVGLHPVLA